MVPIVPPLDRAPSTSRRRHQGERLRPANDFVRFELRDLEQSIPERFARQVARWPERPAVISATQRLSYTQLHERCTHLAQAIIERLGRGEEPVALLFDQGVPMIIAMLSTLTAGKIWVPLDPAFPRERLAFMVRDSGAGLILTNAGNLSMAESFSRGGCRILDVDTLAPCGFAKPPGRLTTPDTLASITYTSGSTGRPKGVMQNHRNLLHTVMSMTNGLHICADDRFASFASPAGAAMGWCSLAGLLNGACFLPVNVKEQAALSTAKWLEGQEVTVTSALPPVYRAFLRGLPPDYRFTHIRMAMIGGDTVQKNDIELFRRHFPQDSLVSPGMGHTETGRIICDVIDTRTPLVDDVIPIGYPVDGMEVLLVDKAGQQVAPDEIGEIVIRSAFLSPGYWRQPELTRRVFVADPDGGPKRLYFTGDLGRRLADGRLVHMGRKDHQVKIRGYRVELSEVEAALLDLPAITDAVVRDYQDANGEKSIVAFVVPAARPAMPIAELRAALGTRLPRHMIPSKFVTLDALPLTVMGKVDRAALHFSATARPELATPFVAPRNPTETALANIWIEVLGVDHVGINDEFLELGGDSLGAMQIAARVNSRFQTELPQSFVFEFATVAELAVALNAVLQGPGRA